MRSMSERELIRAPRRLLLALTTAIAAGSLLSAGAAVAAEPNDSFATATGPLTAGQTFKASLETINDADFQFFYIPDTAQVTVTTINDSKSEGKAANRGRTIVSSLLRGRKGKLPLPLTDTARTLKPRQKGRVKITLVPGKYFIPIGRAETTADPQPNVPFRIQIAPAGTTTDSFEIFERRCKDARTKLERIKESKTHVARKLAEAKRKDHRGKVRKLKAKLRSKRVKAAEAQRIKRIVCSVPR